MLTQVCSGFVVDLRLQDTSPEALTPCHTPSRHLQPRTFDDFSAQCSDGEGGGGGEIVSVWFFVGGRGLEDLSACCCLRLSDERTPGT